MVKIYRGSRPSIGHQLLKESKHDAEVIYLRRANKFSWQGLLSIIHQTGVLKGKEYVQNCINRHKVIASLFQWNLIDELTYSEKSTRQNLVASLSSHLTHNRFIQTHLFDAVASFLIDLLNKEDTLFLPEVASIDNLSLTSITSLYRRYPHKSPHLIMGCPHWEKEEDPVMDEKGIIWKAKLEKIEKARLSFFLIPGATILNLKESNAPLDHERAFFHDTIELETKHWEEQALTLLASKDLLSESEGCFILDTIINAYESFSFKNALKIGLGLIEKTNQLSEVQYATLHSIIALSAHNRQFRSEGNLRLADFIIDHLKKALSVENRPELVCALYYRLAVAYGRRKKEFEEALDWANKAIEQSELLGFPHHEYQKAWALNIRAYLFAMTGKGSESRQDAEVAYHVIEEMMPQLKEISVNMPGISVNDCVKSQSVLAINLTKVAFDEDDLNFWLQKVGDLSTQYPGLDKYEAYNWAVFYRRNQRLDKSLSWAVKGIEMASGDRDPETMYLLQVLSADIATRIGKASHAASLIENAYQLREFLGCPNNLHDLGLSAVRIYIRADYLDKAEALLNQHKLATSDSYDTMAEIYAMKGLIAAIRKNSKLAADMINQAIQMSITSGERDSLLRIACLAGEAAQILDLKKEAAEAFESALEIYNTPTEEKLPPIELIIQTLVGYQETHGYKLNLSEELLKFMSSAFRSFSSEPWWLINRILPFLQCLRKENPKIAEKAQNMEAFLFFIASAKQRVDCPDQIEELLFDAPVK